MSIHVKCRNTYFLVVDTIVKGYNLCQFIFWGLVSHQEDFTSCLRDKTGSEKSLQREVGGGHSFLEEKDFSSILSLVIIHSESA